VVVAVVAAGNKWQALTAVALLNIIVIRLYSLRGPIPAITGGFHGEQDHVRTNQLNKYYTWNSLQTKMKMCVVVVMVNGIPYSGKHMSDKSSSNWAFSLHFNLWTTFSPEHSRVLSPAFPCLLNRLNATSHPHALYLFRMFYINMHWYLRLCYIIYKMLSMYS
jgi:hypothetical protein